MSPALRRAALLIACQTAGLAPWIIRGKYEMWQAPSKRRWFLREVARRFPKSEWRR